MIIFYLFILSYKTTLLKRCVCLYLSLILVVAAAVAFCDGVVLNETTTTTPTTQHTPPTPLISSMYQSHSFGPPGIIYYYH